MHREGSAILVLPDLKKYRRPDGKIEASWMPVFYNPYSRDNRDLTVQGIKTANKIGVKTAVFLEPLAGTCVRSIRVLLETGSVERAYASDISPDAVRLCRENMEANKLGDKLVVEIEDANIFMRRLDREGIIIDVIDIDPYGSPLPYVESAIRALGKEGLLFLTATDVGTLTGKYSETALRRYYSRIHRTSFSREIGARVLIKSLVEKAAMMDRVFKPLYTFYHQHYYKVMGIVKHKRKEASANLQKTGFICMDDHFPQRIFNVTTDSYPPCKKPIGPIWLGSLWDPEYARLLYEEVSSNPNITGVLKRKTRIIQQESTIDSYMYYRTDIISSISGKKMPPLQKVIEKLIEKGYNASRTHFHDNAVRTDAPPAEALNIISSL